MGRGRSSRGSRLVAAAVAVTSSVLVTFALTAPAEAATHVVTLASLQVASLSAKATDDTYSVSFRSTDPLTTGSSTIKIAAAAGTLFQTSCQAVTDDATATTSCASPTVTGATAVLTSPLAVNAGDMVSVRLVGVTNPVSSGDQTLELSTSADPTPVVLHYKLAPATAVTGASLSESADSDGATGVTYSAIFTSPDRLTAASPYASTITIAAPAGTAFPPSGCGPYNFVDATTGQSTDCVETQLSGSTATLEVPFATEAGDVLSVVVDGMTNPATTGRQTVQLSTSADPTPVALHDSLVAVKAVAHAFLQASSYAPSATGVSWSVGFTAPDRLTSAGAGADSSTITLAAPAGTVFPTPGSCSVGYRFLDPSAGIDTTCVSVQLSGDTAVIEAPATTRPGDVVAVIVSGMTNPSSGSLEVSTSSDPKPVKLSLSRPTTAPAALELGSTSAGATQASATATLDLAAPLTADSTVTLSAAAGTVMPTGNCLSGFYAVYDLTSGADANLCYTGAAGATVTMDSDIATAAGDEVAFTAVSVTNASSSGTHTFTVTTSSGADSTASYKLTAPTAVKAPVLQVSSASAGATDVTYSVTFQATNGMTGTYYSGVTLSLPGVTWGPGSGDDNSWTVIDDTTASVGGGFADYSGTGDSTAVVYPNTASGDAIAPGDFVTVVGQGTTNPSVTGANTAALSTGGDPTVVSVSLRLVEAAAVKHPVLAVGSDLEGAASTLSVSFISTDGLTPDWSTITLALAGLGWPPGSGDDDGFTVYDDTTGSGASATAVITASTAVITPGTGNGFAAAPGDVVTVFVTPTTNPSSKSSTLQLSTSADPKVTSVKLTLT